MALEEVAVRRLGAGETFAPRFSMDQIESELPDSMHQRMGTARTYLNELSQNGKLSALKWGVLELVARETPGFAERLNLAAPSQVKAAAVSAGTQATQQRMAGQMPAAVPVVRHAIQNATATSGGRRPRINDIIEIGNNRYIQYSSLERERDFSQIDRPGSLEGAEQGIKRIVGTRFGDGNGRRLEALGRINGDVVIHPEEVLQLWHGDGIWDRNGREGSSMNIDLLRGKMPSAQVLARGSGRLSREEGALVSAYRYGGLHASAAERALQRQALSRYYELAEGRQRADKADNVFEMFGNFIDPYLSDSAVASPRSIYRGDVVPLEWHANTANLGSTMNLSQTNDGVGSFSIEPFQAYRYSMMKRDGRLEKAIDRSSSGEVIRRITEVIPRKGSQLPVINGDPWAEGKSELLHPLASGQLKLRSSNQIYNAAEPEIPLIWQVYS